MNPKRASKRAKREHRVTIRLSVWRDIHQQIADLTVAVAENERSRKLDAETIESLRALYATMRAEYSRNFDVARFELETANMCAKKAEDATRALRDERDALRDAISLKEHAALAVERERCALESTNGVLRTRIRELAKTIVALSPPDPRPRSTHV